MVDLGSFIEEYKKYLSEYLLSGGHDKILYEAYQNILKLLDHSFVHSVDILDIHNRVLKEVLKVEQGNTMIQWSYIERASEFLAQILIIKDTLLFTLKEGIERDPLTGLYNRLAFERIATKLWTNANMRGVPLAVAIFDLDNFKYVNDRYGHVIGDEVLKEISAVIKNSLRDGDVVFRYGGEEFLVLLPETDSNGANKALERIRKRVEENVFTKAGIKLTISIGVAVYPDDSPLTMEETIEFADKAMYVAKAKGKNRVVFYADLSKEKALEVILNGRFNKRTVC